METDDNRKMTASLFRDVTNVSKGFANSSLKQFQQWQMVKSNVSVFDAQYVDIQRVKYAICILINAFIMLCKCVNIHRKCYNFSLCYL